MDIETLIARGFQVLLALGGAYLVALWFVLAVWTFRDIETRSRSVVTQVFSTLLVVLFWIPGLLLYRLLRPKETLDEAYQRSLEEEYLIQDLEELPLCPSCSHFVEDDFQICPNCNTQLREKCVSCERLIDLRWEICPYCGTRHHDAETPAERAVDVSDDKWVDPASIERRLRDAEDRRLREETRALPAATAATTLGRDFLKRPDRQAESPAGDPLGQHEAHTGHTVSIAPGETRTFPAPLAESPGNGTAPAAPSDQPATVQTLGPDLSGLIDPEDDEAQEDPDTVGTIPKRYRVR